MRQQATNQHILRIFAQRPRLPEVHHKVLQTFEPQFRRRLKQALSVKRLAEAPARVHTAERFQSRLAWRASK
jgi:hypothetical protein